MKQTENILKIKKALGEPLRGGCCLAIWHFPRAFFVFKG